MTSENTQEISGRRNVPKFFVDHPHISWMLLAGVLVWGWFGYRSMPQRKDPDIPVRLGVVACPWPGATAQQVEQFITRRIEDVAAQNKTIHPGTDADYGIKSISLAGYSFVTIQLDEGIKDTKRQFSDINLKLNELNSQLPKGAGPITMQSDFGDTSALMLTVASPKADSIEIATRAHSIESTIRQNRDSRRNVGQGRPTTVVTCFPHSVSAREVLQQAYLFQEEAQRSGIIRDSQVIQGSGFIAFDGISAADDKSIQDFVQRFISERLRRSELHPDIWDEVIIHDPSETQAKLATVAGDKFSYAELDDFSDLIARTLQGAPETSKVERRGVLEQRVYLDYSQDRLAAYGLRPADLSRAISARNIIAPGGTLETGAGRVTIIPSGKFDTAKSIGDVVVSTSSQGTPVYLRDLVEISRDYQAPAQYLNYYTWRDAKTGHWQRSRAITIAVYMRDGKQIAKFGQSIEAKLSDLRKILPADLIMAHTSDQPLQVKENIHLFLRALVEAIILVVIVSLLGFWEWRLALIMALAIPITLAMNFGVVYALGIDLQQVSIASLIIALGLLVDVPVVSGDGIKRHLAEGFPRRVACWLGPTKLATAIFYATVTNIIAYLPFLLLTGNTGEFLHSLPIVMTSCLLCALVVSMTFVPFLGYYIQRAPAKPEPSIEEMRERGFYGFYNRLVGKAIKHRWAVLGASCVFLIIGGLFASRLKTQFFPEDVQYWFYVDIWLPNDTPLSVTNDAALRAEEVVRRVIENSPEAKEHHGNLLKSLTTFDGGGGPRFWFSVTPEMPQTNYAQVIVEVTDKEATPMFKRPLQDALDKEVPGAWITVRQLQTNPVENPVELLISAQQDVDAKNEANDIRTLRQIARQAQDIVAAAPGIAVLRDDWFPENLQVRIQIDPDRANVVGITNADVAGASATAMSGTPVGMFKIGDKDIPIVARLRMEERAQLADMKNLYVYSSQTNTRVPLLSVATLGNFLETTRIRRREHFRTISILAYPQPGVLASEIMNSILPRLEDFKKNLPPGYQIRIGGERAKQIEGFDNLKVVLVISLLGIYLALLIQFNNAVKPLLVFAAAPYGAVGALIALSVMHAPFGFMAFLGICSLIGVIVSHVIVLFDFIEEMHAKGEPLEQALPDAGIQRIRPVMITVLATILALFPLALEGGPLWQPLCYAQIGGLAVATFITLLLVPVLYSIFVLDLKIVRWETKKPVSEEAAAVRAAG
jgi:multidrug efflux pump